MKPFLHIFVNTESKFISCVTLHPPKFPTDFWNKSAWRTWVSTEDDMDRDYMIEEALSPKVHCAVILSSDTGDYLSVQNPDLDFVLEWIDRKL